MKPEANLPPPWDLWPSCTECGGANGLHESWCSCHGAKKDSAGA